MEQGEGLGVLPRDVQVAVHLQLSHSVGGGAEGFWGLGIGGELGIW